ncbi:MAG: alpha/beta hydrolase [Dehalococcoidales bacterium]|nr:alpha/beta hydrolase [Dehalococcoidales bacterium]
MNNPRKYGKEPFNIAVIHGGPGASGEMAPVARELSSVTGVLEPLQTADTVEGQVQELRNILQENGNLPLIMIGYSWGAWLGYILAASYPWLVRKLILVSSGPFEEKYAAGIMETRLNRLSGKEKKEALSLWTALNSHTSNDKILARFGVLIGKADAYDPLPHNKRVLTYSSDIHQRVWEQASKLRNSGELLSLGERIQCPVIAIHGDYDPHPAKGVETPLSVVIKDFRFIQLEKCGHCPWLERKAKDRFYDILKSETRLFNHDGLNR